MNKLAYGMRRQAAEEELVKLAGLIGKELANEIAYYTIKSGAEASGPYALIKRIKNFFSGYGRYLAANPDISTPLLISSVAAAGLLAKSQKDK